MNQSDSSQDPNVVDLAKDPCNMGSMPRSTTVFAIVFAWLMPCTLLCADETETNALTYVRDHCIRCHGVDEQNADRRFDSLGAEFSDHQSAEHRQEILDVVNLGEIPSADEPQPSSDDTKRFIATITRQLDLARQSLASGESEDIAELKRLLLKQKDQFARCLTEKMLTYALG